jgi:transcriptional regulator with XRE-family HTH domain
MKQKWTCQTRCMSTIGTRIRARRKALGLTQIDLAVAIGVKQNTLSEIETGKTREMEAFTLAGLCRELRLTPEFVVFGHGVCDDDDLAVIESEMVAIIRSITPDQREMLLGMARGAYEVAMGTSKRSPVIAGKLPPAEPPATSRH